MNEFTKEGGRYYRAQAYYWASVALFLPLIIIALIVSHLNPFWFRYSLIELLEDVVNHIARKRNYRMKAIYLGCDPEFWSDLNRDYSEDKDD
jgi:hypothetical protein